MDDIRPVIDVTAAVFVKNGRIAAFRRGPSMKHSGRWEFPGGKIEAGEEAEACLRREIYEELGVSIGPVTKLKEVIHVYETFTIRLIPFLVPTGLEAFLLTEHDAYLWITPAEASSLDWLEADIPVLDQVKRMEFSNF